MPEKIKSFMWLFLHGRVHTNQLRMQRRVVTEALCPFACLQEEDSMHLIRDRSNAINRWKSVVDPNLWSSFFTLTGAEWVKWNLTHDVGQTYTDKVPWPMLFGYICWDIWVLRCKKVFGDPILEECCSVGKSFYKAC